MTLAETIDELGAARTNKKEFLEKLERIIPWAAFTAIIQPFYYKGEKGNKPYPLELMLRIYLLQNVYTLADDEWYKSISYHYGGDTNGFFLIYNQFVYFERRICYMKLKIHTKVFSCIMIVALLICSVQTVNAAEYIRDIDISDSQSVFLSEKDLPEAVESEITSEKGHIKRLSSKETRLDTIIFANADGSETIYIFDENVKYTDSSGNTHDKSNLLYATERSKYQYTNKDNDIQTFFPITLNAATGVILEHDDISIEMYPATTVSATAIKKKDSSGTEYVYYDNAFGPKTSLRYKTTFSGFKEEIVLYENVGSTFRFYVECGDLIPTINNGIIEFYSSSENLVVASIDSIFVYDSYIGVATDERHETWNNTVSLSKISNGKYQINVCVDEAFLSRDATVYPVYVDPSITITASGSGATETIIDTPIYNGSGVTNITSGNNASAVLGFVGTLNNVQYGSGRLLMKFPGLMTQSFMSNQNYIISSATLYLKEASGNSASATISAHIYTGPAWSESSTYSYSIWNGSYKKNGVEQTLSTYSYSYPNYTTGSFNITQAVRLWQSNPSYGDKGILLKNRTSETDGTYYKSLYTSEGATKPYISVTYATRSNASNAFLTYGSTTRNITLQLKGTTTTNSTWLPIINASRNAWNSSNANTNITTTTTGTSVYTLTVAAFPTETWYGLTTTSLSGGVAVSAKIEINTSTIGSSTAFRRSTVTHELAHLMWLNDNPSTTDFSLMRHDRDREIIYTPQMIDIYHLLKKY